LYNVSYKRVSGMLVVQCSNAATTPQIQCSNAATTPQQQHHNAAMQQQHHRFNAAMPQQHHSNNTTMQQCRNNTTDSMQQCRNNTHRFAPQRRNDKTSTAATAHPIAATTTPKTAPLPHVTQAPQFYHTQPCTHTPPRCRGQAREGVGGQRAKGVGRKEGRGCGGAPVTHMPWGFGFRVSGFGFRGYRSIGRGHAEGVEVETGVEVEV
jgi:hypothetical protein